MDNLVPMHYNLHLEPNLETFKFKGTTEFTFELSSPASNISLHALDLNFSSIQVKEDHEFVDVEGYDLNLEKQQVNINLGKEVSGQQTVLIEYEGEHNDKLEGWYRGQFKTQEGESKYCVVSQFQPTDARRAFPCIDVPGEKATFTIEFLIQEADLFAVSNMPIVHEEVYEDGSKLVKFDTTPKMSTYLLFFGVGDFEYIGKEENGRNFRTIAHPPKAQKHGKFSLDFGIKVVDFCEDYFDYEYPLPKLDQIATPAFAAGAMENWGAILYRENALLRYEGITSKNQENSILSVIAHEIAHQWFGNLVSPKTWKWLWLNESFATFFATKVVDHYYPERKMFEFYVASTNLSRRSRSTSGVMAWDGMIETSPIELPGDGTINFTAKTIPILYSKGGSILRQVEAYLGDEGFRDGLRAYFKKYAYGSSESDYLWNSLEEVTGKPVTKMMQSFVLQEGLPLVTIERDGNKMTLKQERFTYLPYESDNQWIVPVTIKLFKGGKLVDEQVLELADTSQTFDLPEFDAYKMNTDMTGFYRCWYPEEDYEMLKELVKSDALTAIDRLVLEDELFALLKATKIDLEHYLDFIEAYSGETSHVCLFSIAAHLRDIHELLEGEKKDEMAKRTREFFTKVFDQIGYTPQEDEDIGISVIRGSLLLVAVEFDLEPAKQFALGEYEKIKNDEEISADLRSSIKAIGAKLENEFDWFKEQFDNPESESEFVSTIVAMTKFDDLKLLEKTRDIIFSEIPSRNRGYAINSLCRNPKIKDDMFEWYIANLDSLENLSNFIFQGTILSTVQTGIDRYEEVEEWFDEYRKKNKIASDAVDVGLEQLKIDMQLRTHLNK